MPEPVSSSLGGNDIAELSQRFFASGPEALQEAADEIALPALCTTLLETLDRMAAEVADLPASAFTPQPDDVDGSDVWSAGEIIRHLAEMELAALPFWEQVMDCNLPDPPPALIAATAGPPAGKRACAEVLELMRVQNARTLGRVNDTRAGDERAMHFVLGFTSVRAAVLGSCIHLVDHCQQLAALRRLPD